MRAVLMSTYLFEDYGRLPLVRMFRQQALLLRALYLQVWSRKLRQRIHPGAFYVVLNGCSTLDQKCLHHRLLEVHAHGNCLTLLMSSLFFLWSLPYSFWKLEVYHLSHVDVSFYFAWPDFWSVFYLHSSSCWLGPPLCAKVGVACVQ